MMQFLQQISLIASQANETDEERAERLSTAADQAGISAATLYETERDLRTLARQYANENEEKVDAVTSQMKGLAPMLGVDPEAADDVLGAETGIKLATMKATARPAVTAKVVKTLHEAFERRGLYDELGTETPAPGELEPVVDVEAVDVGEGK